MFKIQEILMLSDKGYKNLKSAIWACVLTNFSRMLPFTVIMLTISELLRVLVDKKSGLRLIIYMCLGLISVVIIFLAGKNDYKDLHLCLSGVQNTRIGRREHLRKLPRVF